MAKTTKQAKSIRFRAKVWGVKTLADGGLNVTLLLPENDIKNISRILECKQSGAFLEVVATPLKVEKKEEHAKKGKADQDRGTKRRTRRQRYPYRDSI